MLKALKNISVKYFYFIWFALTILQAATTELLPDECYYWKYSTKLDWGYFNHPPATAFFIWLGTLFFKNEIGVRLFFAVCSTATIYITEKLIEVKNKTLYYAILASLGIFHLFGFLAIPDVPLLFFVSLFFYALKQYYIKDEMKWALLLAIAMAGLAYSKYTTVVIVLLAFVSLPQLFLKRSFYVSCLVALLLYAPHLIWQYQHDFVSFQYHLSDRAWRPYTISQTFEFMGGQLLLLLPLTGFLLVFSLKKKSADVFFKVMRLQLIGLFVFFFLLTFKNRVEINWTLPSVYSLAIPWLQGD